MIYRYRNDLHTIFSHSSGLPYLYRSLSLCCYHPWYYVIDLISSGMSERLLCLYSTSSNFLTIHHSRSSVFPRTKSLSLNALKMVNIPK